MDRLTDLNILASTEIFRSLSNEVLDEARRFALRKRLAKGDVLYHQGDAVTNFYVVVVGRLRVTQTTSQGDQITLRYLGPGEMVGYAALSHAPAHSATVIAVDDTHLFAWTKGAIQQLMMKHPQVAMNAVAVLGARYQETQMRLRELSTESVERRIAHTLLRLASRAGRRTAEGIEIAFPLTRQDLAELAGTTLYTVSRILSAWEKEGIVMSGRRHVILCRPHALTMIDDKAESRR